MNGNEQILAELRKIAAWADMQRRATKWGLIFIAVFVPLLIVFGVVVEQKTKKHLAELGRPAEQQTWYDVQRHVCLGELDTALETGENLIKNTPLYPAGHRRLAEAYLASGRLDKAAEHYREAFRLFPSKKNAEAPEVVNSRIAQERPE